MDSSEALFVISFSSPRRSAIILEHISFDAGLSVGSNRPSSKADDEVPFLREDEVRLLRSDDET